MALITLTLKKWRRNPLSQTRIERALATLQGEYAEQVVRLYDSTTALWDDGPKASAIQREGFSTAGRRRINIYPRGEGKMVYFWIDHGFQRRVAILPGYIPKTAPGVLGGIVGGGRKGQVVGHVLKQPVPVEARRFTAMIADIVRNGSAEVMPFKEYMRRGLHERVFTRYMVTRTIK